MIKTYEPTDDPLVVVDRMLEILAVPEQWCKGISFNPIELDIENDPRIESVCLIGARIRANTSLKGHDEVGGWVKLDLCRPTSEFNDDPNTTHADILAHLLRVRSNIIQQECK